ncbi:MAG TPA: DUF2752 domain-containing protein, partial [Chthoniobacteraceae bacterium]|nr:DUF2752 domain-containing protein [Chthoniobacteraceae bacterium]
MAWRRLRAGEVDHEALWLGVSAACAGGAWLWTTMRLPTPPCVFHALTGLPCPTCGATRCFVHLVHGAWREALLANPLIFAAFAAIAAFDLYAASVIATGRPRWRCEISARQLAKFRFSAIALIAL